MPSSDTQFNPVTGSEAVREGYKVKTSIGKREIRRQAGFIAGFCYKVLHEMSETLSFSDPETARANAQAVSSIGRVWESGVERLRIVNGDPLPGSKRPAPDAPKRKARTSLPPVPRPELPPQG